MTQAALSKHLAVEGVNCLSHTPGTPLHPHATPSQPHSSHAVALPPPVGCCARPAACPQSRPCARFASSGRGGGRSRSISGTAPSCTSARGMRRARAFQTRAGRARPGGHAGAAVAGAWVCHGRSGEGPPGAPGGMRGRGCAGTARVVRASARASPGGRGGVRRRRRADRGDGNAPPPARVRCGDPAEHLDDAALVRPGALARTDRPSGPARAARLHVVGESQPGEDLAPDGKIPVFGTCAGRPCRGWPTSRRGAPGSAPCRRRPRSSRRTGTRENLGTARSWSSSTPTPGRCARGAERPAPLGLGREPRPRPARIRLRLVERDVLHGLVVRQRLDAPNRTRDHPPASRRQYIGGSAPSATKRAYSPFVTGCESMA